MIGTPRPAVAEYERMWSAAARGRRRRRFAILGVLLVGAAAFGIAHAHQGPPLPVGYAHRTETDGIRGLCAEGYVPAGRVGAAAPPFPCVYDAESDDPIRAVMGISYPYRLNLVCGVVVAQFDARVFTSRADFGHMTDRTWRDLGTMTLGSGDQARFRGRGGEVVDLVAEANYIGVGCSGA